MGTKSGQVDQSGRIDHKLRELWQKFQSRLRGMEMTNHAVVIGCDYSLDLQVKGLISRRGFLLMLMMPEVSAARARRMSAIGSGGPPGKLERQDH